MSKLLEATIDIIVESGWHEATSRKVAERAGVSLGVIHYHVDSIAELRRVAALGVIEQYFAGIAAEVLPLADPTEAVRTLFKLFANGVVGDRELSVLYQALVASRFDDELRAAQAVILQAYREGVTEFLKERGIGNPASVAATIVAVGDGFLLQRALDTDVEPKPIVDGLITLLDASRQR